MKLQVKPDLPALFRISIARRLFEALLLLVDPKSRPASVDLFDAEEDREVAAVLPHLDELAGDLQMMSVRVLDGEELPDAGRLDLARHLLAAPDVHPEDVVGDEDVGSVRSSASSSTTRSGDFSRKVDSWNFHTEQKLHLKGQPRAVSSSARACGS